MMLTTVTPPPADADLRRLLFAQVLRHESQPAAHHVAVHENLFHHAAYQIDGNCEADALGSSVGSIEHGRIDADQIAMRIDERAAGVAEIDGGVGLDEVLECRQTQLAASRRAHDSLSHRLAQAVGISDGQHDIADPQGIGAAERHDRQLADLEVAEWPGPCRGLARRSVASAMRPSASCTRIESAPAMTC